MRDKSRDYFPKKYHLPRIRQEEMNKRYKFYSSALFYGFFILILSYFAVFAIGFQVFSTIITVHSAEFPDYFDAASILFSAVATYLVKVPFRVEPISTEVYDESGQDPPQNDPWRIRLLLSVVLITLIPVSAFLALNLQQIISDTDLLKAMSNLSGMADIYELLINLSVLVGASGAIGISLSSVALLASVALYRTEMRFYVWLRRLLVLAKFSTLELSDDEYEKRCPQCYNNTYAIERIEGELILSCDTCGVEKSRVILQRDDRET